MKLLLLETVHFMMAYIMQLFFHQHEDNLLFDAYHTL